MIAIIDYGISNIKSVSLAFQDISDTTVVQTGDEKQLRRASRIVLPGVCSYLACMDALNKLNLVEVIKELVIEKAIPILGICVGMQVFSSIGHEYGENKGLGLVDGNVVRLETKRVPHMGWNKCKLLKESGIFTIDQQYYYFANSFHFIPADPEVIMLKTCYEFEMAAAIEKNNIYGCQFHPERSGKEGMRILQNFLSI